MLTDLLLLLAVPEAFKVTYRNGELYIVPNDAERGDHARSEAGRRDRAAGTDRHV